jgi:SAM-dependent methyltransferase
MTTVVQDTYSLGRSPEEYERLRAQALAWEEATGRVLDRVGLAPGAGCLDAGCGPGETMRLMAERVGPTGHVQGIDMDASIGAMAVERLHAAGHRQCRFDAFDLTGDAPIPGAPYDLVYARLLLFHLPERVAVLARLWDAVAPGGHLVIQDYDLEAADVVPTTGSATEMVRVLTEAFTAAGCDVRAGARLPGLFAEAGVGEPDGTDVTGRLERLATGYTILEHTFRSLLPTAIAHGITSERHAGATLAAYGRDVAAFPDRSFLWPSMNGAWKRKARE